MTIPILSIVGVRYGVPDIGLLGAREFADAYRDMLAVTDLPALVDADNGYDDHKSWPTSSRASSMKSAAG